MVDADGVVSKIQNVIEKANKATGAKDATVNSAVDRLIKGYGSGSNSGSSGGSVARRGDVNFYDYDGTLVYSYTLDEAKAMTELPAMPVHEGLTAQRWNYSLDTLKKYTRAVDVGATYTTDDGTTRIYIRLEDGRTSPMLGVCPKGTVDVDWGDGTAHNKLTGTSTGTAKWTPTHEYASAGDYVIRLTVDGKMGFCGSSSSNQYAGILRYSSSGDSRNYAYRNAVRRVEIGDSVTSIGDYAFYYCYSLANVVIPDSVTSIASYAFRYCSSLASVVIPDSVTSIGSYAFQSCYSLASVVIPDSVTSIASCAFQTCSTLASVAIPDSVTSIGTTAFRYCPSLASVVIPDSVTSIGATAFCDCSSLASVVIPDGVTSIGSATFQYCCSLKYCDFTKCTTVPTLASTDVFSSAPDDFEIRVPMALVDEWKSATNWATYASKIVGVEV